MMNSSNIMDDLDAYIPDNYPQTHPGNQTNPFLLQAATSTSGVGVGGVIAPSGGGGVVFPHQYPMEHIDYPGMNDVMCGRGGGTNNHIGNIRFRQLVNEHKRRYLAASKVDKPRVALEVVQIWRELDPPGRFLTKTDLSQGDDSLWHDVGDKKAREKASQCLRERTPDVIPFVKQLQEKEKEEKEKKLANKKEKGGGSDRSSSHQSGSKRSTNSSNKSSTRTTSKTQPDTTISFKDDKEAPDGVVSSSTSSNDAGQEKKQQQQQQPRQRKKKTKEEIANSIPTAAALMNEVFSEDEDDDHDHDDDDEDDNNNDVLQDLDMESYQRSVEEYLDTAPKGDGVDGYSVADRSLLMETLSTTSWVKSFKSVDTSSSVSSAAMIMSASSLRDVLENKGKPGTAAVGNGEGPAATEAASGAVIDTYRKSDLSSSKGTMPTSNVYRPPNKKQQQEGGDSRTEKLQSLQGGSQMSMISDLTDMSGKKSSRSAAQALAIANAESKSTISKRSLMSKGETSMFSEMTELSDEIKSMDLSSGT